MRLLIKANQFIFKRSMEVHEGYVDFVDEGSRRLLVEDIDAVLLSERNVLSLQVGYEVFQIPVKPDNPVHQRTIEALTEQVSRAGQPRPAPAP